MPGRDGTGPVWKGSNNGRGLGLGLARKRGFGRGFCRYFAINRNSSKTQKEFLKEEKTRLQDRLEFIEKQLENL